jgi:hypothetical protein
MSYSTLCKGRCVLYGRHGHALDAWQYIVVFSGVVELYCISRAGATRVENVSRDVEEGGADIGVGQDKAHATIDLGGVPQEHSDQRSQSSIMRA